ncbi:MAG: acyl-CoA dehydrogenase family protein [Thermocrispum sp.]
MDLDLDPDTGKLRDELRGWLADNIQRAPRESYDTARGFALHREWEARLAADRWSAVNWPRAFGGRDASTLQWVVFEEEYFAAGGPPRVSQNGITMLAPTLFSHGTPEQRERILPPMARGEEVWAQAWSEPEAGSDIAALRSTANRTEDSGGGWLLSGQKTWSSRASFADKAFGLFRSEPGSQRHHGLTYLMFDLHADGVRVRPIPQLDGQPGFAEIFLDDVFVPDDDVIGVPGEGWKAAMTTANNERGLSLRSPGRYLAAAARLVDLWRDSGSADSGLAARVADAWIGARAYQLYTFGTVSRLAEGGSLGPESSVNKLHWSGLDLALHETALDLLGPDGELESDWLPGYLFALGGPIYGGTDQIQRNTVAERVLGLPR